MKRVDIGKQSDNHFLGLTITCERREDLDFALGVR